MLNQELVDLSKLSYEDVVKHLQDKYGIPKKPYFANDTFRSKNKIAKTNDGLVIHHVCENKAIMLSTTEFAKQNPFSYQEPENLVYCNLLEHLLLHIKIVQGHYEADNKKDLVGIGGIVNFIMPQLNDIYAGYEYKQAWKQKIADVVKNDEETYFYLVNLFLDGWDDWLNWQNSELHHTVGDEMLLKAITTDSIYGNHIDENYAHQFGKFQDKLLENCKLLARPLPKLFDYIEKSGLLK